MSDRIRVHPEYGRMIKAKAAACGMSIREYTRQLAGEEPLSSLSLNNTFKDKFGVQNEKKSFKFTL